MKKSHFRYWELALLLALAVTILWGAASLGQQEELGRKVIRLHVIANSDSPEDQALKLRVRDRVLARAQEILEQSADMEQAEQALTAQLRPGVTPESCADAFMVCAAWMALDGLSAAGGSGEVTSFTAGDVSIQTGNGGSSGSLTEQIQRLMAPYLRDGGFYFQGVTG